MKTVLDKQRIEALESALKIIRTWAVFDISRCKNSTFVAALIPQDVIKLCDKVLK